MFLNSLAEQTNPNKILVPIEGFKDFMQALGLELPNPEVVNDANYGEPPATPEVGSPEDNSFKVECISVVPRVRERFSSFHSAYLYAYQLAEAKKVQVEIAYQGKYIMFVRPDREVRFL